MAVVAQDSARISVLELDRVALGDIVRRVVSEPEFRELFQRDTAAAIEQSGVTMSPTAKEALVRNAGLASGLTENMDTVASAVFFFFVA